MSKNTVYIPPGPMKLPELPELPELPQTGLTEQVAHYRRERNERYMHYLMDLACIRGSADTLTVVERLKIALADREYYQRAFINAMRKIMELTRIFNITTHTIEPAQKEKEE